jgi:hypothetical protein
LTKRSIFARSMGPSGAALLSGMRETFRIISLSPNFPRTTAWADSIVRDLQDGR